MRPSSRSLVAVAAFMLLGISGAAKAQGWPPLGAARPGATVRVQLVTGDTLEGTLVSADPLSLRLRTPEGERAVPPGSVMASWERVPAPGRGAVRGALVGGLALGVGGTVLNVAACESECGNQAEQGLIAVAVGTGVGALIGAAWGALSGRWAQRSP